MMVIVIRMKQAQRPAVRSRKVPLFFIFVKLTRPSLTPCITLRARGERK